MYDLGCGDFLKPSELSKVQQDRWEKQRVYVQQNSEFFQNIWKSAIIPKRLEEISRLPLCDKAMLRNSQTNSPPFGNYLAAPLHRLVRVHRTSGTTGQAMNVAMTAEDTMQTACIGARSHKASGLNSEDLVIHCLNYQMWMGGITDHLSLEATGATVIPFGIGNSELLIRTLRDMPISAIHSTPSYPAVLEQTISQKFPGVKPTDFNLRLGLFGGEAGLDSVNFRQRLEETWGYQVRNANYGVSDVFSNFAGQCEKSNDLHFVGPDVLYPELVKPDTTEVISWKEGSTGELVLTHLAREAQPLVRFRTNDLIVISGTDPCQCGRTTTRFRVLGRTDDMVVVRGVNIYPAAVADIIQKFPESSGEFRIVLRGTGPYDRLELEVEVVDLELLDETLARKIADSIKVYLRASANVTLAPPYSLPRTEGKTKRIFREHMS